MKLVFVKDSRTRGYVILGIDSGEGAAAYTVEASVYSSLGLPLCGEFLSEDAFSLIIRRDEVFRATKKALSLLAYSDNNPKSLSLKLRRAGFSTESVRECVEQMLRLGYIDEGRQLRRLILSEARGKLVGMAKITPKLIAKGYKREQIVSVADELCETGELDFEEIKRLLISKKLGDDPQQEEKKALLFKHGFGISDWQ